MTQTLEALAFMFPLEEGEAAPPPASERVDASVRFEGPLCGTLAVSVPAELMGPLAANMLGLMEAGQASPEQRGDALRELLNVTCGNLLPELTSPADVYLIQQPTIRPRQPEPPATAPPRGCDGECTILLGMGSVDVRLYVHAAVEPAAG